MSMIDQLRERRLPPLHAEKKEAPQGPSTEPFAQSSLKSSENTVQSELKRLQDEFQAQHRAVSKAQNNLDLFSCEFTPKELPWGWNYIYTCKDGVIVSLDPSIKLNEFGTKILSDTRKFGRTKNARQMLFQANQILQRFTQVFLTEIKTREAIMADLAGKIEKIEDDLRKTAKSIQQKENSPGFFRLCFSALYRFFASLFSCIFCLKRN